MYLIGKVRDLGRKFKSQANQVKTIADIPTINANEVTSVLDDDHSLQ